MVKLEIISRSEYMYDLIDEYGQKYMLNLEFFDIDEELKIGDYIYINEELLNKKYDGYSTSYTFGNLENEYGKPNISLEDVDIIKVEIENKEIYLKRLYG